MALLLARIPRGLPSKHMPRIFQCRKFSTNSSRPVVSILGPPNAGKSTLFNQLACKTANKSYRLKTDSRRVQSNARLGYNRRVTREVGAIVSSVEGTTRDRRECVGRIGGTIFDLVDTAGVDSDRLRARKESMEEAMMRQTLIAATRSDLVLLMFDARSGSTYDLTLIARWLRKNAKGMKIAVLANKLEGDRWSFDEDSPVLDALEEAGRLGFGKAIPIAAAHGEGFADIAALIESVKGEGAWEEEGNPPLQLAILGRPNVGKSTLVNSILGNERCITGPTPGITRDAIATPFTYQNHLLRLVDTAGIRKISQREHDDTIEDQAVRDAMRALKTADVAALVLDSTEEYIYRQELAIANAVVKEGRSLVIVANKMDLIVDKGYSPEQFRNAVQRQIEMRIPSLRKTPVIVTNSLEGQGIQDLLPAVIDAKERWERVISTGMLNRWLKDVLETNPPPRHATGRPIRIKYITQTKGRPPTFLLFTNFDEIPLTYLAYLKGNFQDTFSFYGMDIRLAIKKSASKNPFKTNSSNGSGIGGSHARREKAIKQLKKFGGKKKKTRSKRQISISKSR